MVGLRNLFARRGVMPSSTGLVVHALHKSASMFLHKFFHDLCERLDCPYFSIHNVPANESNIPDSINHSFVPALFEVSTVTRTFIRNSSTFDICCRSAILETFWFPSIFRWVGDTRARIGRTRRYGVVKNFRTCRSMNSF